jgi:hypothetical protein
LRSVSHSSARADPALVASATTSTSTQAHTVAISILMTSVLSTRLFSGNCLGAIWAAGRVVIQ